MNIQFSDKDPKVVLKKLQDVLSQRELGKIVQFDLEGGDMVVTISKLGTSILTFRCDQNASGCQFSLTKEKIAFAHRPLRGEVTQKIMKVVEKAGGLIQGG